MLILLYINYKLIFHKWQLNSENSSLAKLAVYMNFTFMQVYHLLYVRKS